MNIARGDGGNRAETGRLQRSPRRAVSSAMLEDEIAKLEARRDAAAADGDIETAELLTDAIARLRSGESGPQPAAAGPHGPGTSQESYRRDPPRRLPKRPDPMTKGHKPGGRRRS